MKLEIGLFSEDVDSWDTTDLAKTLRLGVFFVRSPVSEKTGRDDSKSDSKIHLSRV